VDLRPLLSYLPDVNGGGAVFEVRLPLVE